MGQQKNRTRSVRRSITTGPLRRATGMESSSSKEPALLTYRRVYASNLLACADRAAAGRRCPGAAGHDQRVRAGCRYGRIAHFRERRAQRHALWHGHQCGRFLLAERHSARHLHAGRLLSGLPSLSDRTDAAARRDPASGHRAGAGAADGRRGGGHGRTRTRRSPQPERDAGRNPPGAGAARRLRAGRVPDAATAARRQGGLGLLQRPVRARRQPGPDAHPARRHHGLQSHARLRLLFDVQSRRNQGRPPLQRRLSGGVRRPPWLGARRLQQGRQPQPDPGQPEHRDAGLTPDAGGTVSVGLLDDRFSTIDDRAAAGRAPQPERRGRPGPLLLLRPEQQTEHRRFGQRPALAGLLRRDRRAETAFSRR